jgi:hypothetical protein
MTAGPTKKFRIRYQSLEAVIEFVTAGPTKISMWIFFSVFFTFLFTD